MINFSSDGLSEPTAVTRRVVGVFRSAYPIGSETFITNQASSLTRYEPRFIVRKKLGRIVFPHFSPGRSPREIITTALYALTGLWLFFWAKKDIHDIELVHAHFGPDGMYALKLSEHLEVPLVVTFHGFDCTSTKLSLLRTRVWSNIKFAIFERDLIKSKATFVAVSDYIYDRLVSRGYPASQIIRHYIGVDTDQFSAAADCAREDAILCVARHTEKKGVDNLLRAFKVICDSRDTVNLVLIGSGDLTPDLKSLAVDLGIHERVKFLGSQPHHVVVEHMRKSKVFCMFGRVAKSGDAEGLGIVFNEASACGLPIVAVDAGGTSEAVVDGVNGYLIEGINIDHFAAKTLSLLNDHEIWTNFSRSATNLVRKKFNIREQAVSLEAIYDHAILSFDSLGTKHE